MKKSEYLALFLTALVGMVAVAGSVRADTGAEAAPRLEEGRTLENDAVNISTGDARRIIGGSANRPGLAIFNNTAFTLWIAGGTSSATVAAGFPVISSATFTLQSMGGDIYGIMDAAAGAAGGDIRVIRGRVK